MRRRAVFFDRDNTLIVGNEYLGDPEKVVLMPGAADAVARARAMGFAVVIVSNQSGVARGMFDEDAVRAVNRRLDELLKGENPAAIIDCHEFCPFHPDGTVERYRNDSELRKPKPGMILAAAERLALDLRGSWLIGDAPRDVEAGHAAGCRTILFQPERVAPSPAAQQAWRVQPEFVVTTLKEAIDYVEQHQADEVVTAPPLSASDAVDVAAPDAVAKTQATSRTATRAAPSISNASSSPQVTRLVHLSEQILGEIKNLREQPPVEFSLSKLFAGIVQIIAIALLPWAYLNRASTDAMLGLLLAAIFLQTLTIALLIMGRQR
jgi:D-glycero-D-manno-heptose 1,7-bisphosphate phosphatase